MICTEKYKYQQYICRWSDCKKRIRTRFSCSLGTWPRKEHRRTHVPEKVTGNNLNRPNSVFVYFHTSFCRIRYRFIRATSSSSPRPPSFGIVSPVFPVSRPIPDFYADILCATRDSEASAASYAALPGRAILTSPARIPDFRSPARLPFLQGDR